MNPNIPYGQPLPMQPHQRRHDGSYVPLPPHMRPHPGYQPYYPQQMGPMMPQYPQHYAPNWYPYQQHHMHPSHQARPQYYPQAPMPMPQYPQQHYSPMVVSSQQQQQQQQQPQHSQASPRPQHAPSPAMQHQHTSSPSTASAAHVQAPPSPPLSTTSTANARKGTPSQTESTASILPPSEAVERVQTRDRFFPPVPWLSVEFETFPPRAPRRRRRIPKSLLASEPIVYPIPESTVAAEQVDAVSDTGNTQSDKITGHAPTPIQTPTPLPSDAPSDAFSTQPTTPSSAIPTNVSKLEHTPTQGKSRPVVPIVPIVPALPHSPTSAKRIHRDSIASTQSKTSDKPVEPTVDQLSAQASTAIQEELTTTEDASKESAPAQPKSWANLFRSGQGQNDLNTASTNTTTANGLLLNKNESLSDVLNDMNSFAGAAEKITFLQPRGLVNTGNMCYMNSVLQVLVFCTPFYDFLTKVARRATHTFKSDTPLINAMIMFVQEYRVIDSANSVDQLRLRLKPDDYEKYGESFIPEYVYTATKLLPRFREMRRGHQQDAQEFLGFLLEELHEECARSVRTSTSNSSGRTTPVGNSNAEEVGDDQSGWMEVGHKQKPAVTRSSGGILSDSPINNIFGGKLRSELKVSGNKLSITLEPYSPLQLDIGAPEVNNIIDALKGLTRPESMQGDFQSSRGTKATATKQVFIETLPPVLILHLKRFHYDNTSKRAEKIWKQVGYPLELEIPKEVFPVQARNKFAAHGGLPKYRLAGVIYHHGKNANGGHYTADIRRQDGREWIRIDDTVIRRIRSEEVAEGGSEEDPKILAAALDRHNKQAKAGANRFEQIDQEEEDDDAGSEKLWSQVNGHSRSKSTLAGISGMATPGKSSSGLQTPNHKYSVKDNKVAYLLFYQKISA